MKDLASSLPDRVLDWKTFGKDMVYDRTTLYDYLDGGAAVDVSDRLAAVAAADQGLALIDVTDPKAPVLKSLLDTPGEAQNLFLAGTFILVADTYSLLILK